MCPRVLDDSIALGVRVRVRVRIRDRVRIGARARTRARARARARARVRGRVRVRVRVREVDVEGLLYKGARAAAHERHRQPHPESRAARTGRSGADRERGWGGHRLEIRLRLS